MGHVKLRQHISHNFIFGVEKFEGAISRTTVTLEEILMELIIKWYQTPIKFAPVSNWTHDKNGQKKFSWQA